LVHKPRFGLGLLVLKGNYLNADTYGSVGLGSVVVAFQENFQLGAAVFHLVMFEDFYRKKCGKAGCTTFKKVV